MKLKIFDYEGIDYETEYDLEDIDHITCIILTGDEFLRVYLKDGTVVELDAASFSNKPRIESYFDGVDDIPNDELYEWNQRQKARVWYGG